MSDTKEATATRPRITIYTDGGARPNPGGPGGWGVLMITGPHRKELSGGEPETTNNRMEIMGAIAALESLKRPCEIVLYTDSQYLRTGISEWLPGWVKNGWRTASRKPVKNQDLWQRLHAAAQAHRIDWRWVKAHAGDPCNERVDQLATEARERIELGARSR